MSRMNASLICCFWVVLLSVRISSGQSLEEANETRAKAVAPKIVKSSPQELEKAAQLMIEQTNALRKKEELSLVEYESALTATSQYFANYMAKENKFSHTADGKRPAQRVKEYEYSHCLLSENIAYVYLSQGFSSDSLATQVVTIWEESPEHLKNMLDPDVTDIGVAVAQNEKTGYYFAVQMFGRPKSRSITFTIVNHSSETLHYQRETQSLTLPPGYHRVHASCRSTKIALYTQAENDPEEKQLVSAFKPADKSTFVVSEVDGKFQVRKETRQADAEKE